MSIPGGLGQSKRQSGTHPDHRVLGDPQLGRDLVGGAETDAADIARQAIGVLGDEGDRLLAVGLEDPHGARRANAVCVQEQHDLADRLLFGPARHDPVSSLSTDPVTSRSRADSCSMRSNTASPKARTRARP